MYDPNRFCFFFFTIFNSRHSDRILTSVNREFTERSREFCVSVFFSRPEFHLNQIIRIQNRRDIFANKLGNRYMCFVIMCCFLVVFFQMK